MKHRRQVVDGFDAGDARDIDRAAAMVVGVGLALEVVGDGLSIEGRAVLELDAGPQLEGPVLEIGAGAPREREARYRLAVIVEAGQRLEDERGNRLRAGVVDADHEWVEAGNVLLNAERRSTAPRLRCRRQRQGRRQRDKGDPSKAPDAVKLLHHR